MSENILINPVPPGFQVPLHTVRKVDASYTHMPQREMLVCYYCGRFLKSEDAYHEHAQSNHLVTAWLEHVRKEQRAGKGKDQLVASATAQHSEREISVPDLLIEHPESFHDFAPPMASNGPVPAWIADPDGFAQRVRQNAYQRSKHHTPIGDPVSECSPAQDAAGLLYSTVSSPYSTQYSTALETQASSHYSTVPTRYSTHYSTALETQASTRATPSTVPLTFRPRVGDFEWWVANTCMVEKS